MLTNTQFSIDHGNINACKLVLECGADPEWEDATGTTPVEIAWHNILHLRALPKISGLFSVLFLGTEFLQERNLRASIVSSCELKQALSRRISR